MIGAHEMMNQPATPILSGATELTQHAVVDAHVDRDTCLVDIHVGSWDASADMSSKPIAVTLLRVAFAPPWDMDYTPQLGEVANTHPDWTGLPPVKPNNHCFFDLLSEQWVDPRTLADLKAAKWAEIKQARTQAEYAGFTWDGSTFDSDAVSQSRISGAIQLSLMVGEAFTINWTLADNTVRTLSAADMSAVALALGQHVQAQFVKAQALRAQIDTALTAEDVDAVVW